MAAEVEEYTPLLLYDTAQHKLLCQVTSQMLLQDKGFPDHRLVVTDDGGHMLLMGCPRGKAAGADGQPRRSILVFDIVKSKIVVSCFFRS